MRGSPYRARPPVPLAALRIAELTATVALPIDSVPKDNILDAILVA
jgi:hypothetical protein